MDPLSACRTVDCAGDLLLDLLRVGVLYPGCLQLGAVSAVGGCPGPLSPLRKHCTNADFTPEPARKRKIVKKSAKVTGKTIMRTQGLQSFRLSFSSSPLSSHVLVLV